MTDFYSFSLVKTVDEKQRTFTGLLLKILRSFIFYFKIRCCSSLCTFVGAILKVKKAIFHPSDKGNSKARDFNSQKKKLTLSSLLLNNDHPKVFSSRAVFGNVLLQTVFLKVGAHYLNRSFLNIIIEYSSGQTNATC